MWRCDQVPGVSVMHELSIAQALLEVALNTAAEHDAKRISTIRLRIGGLRQIVEESLRQGFELLSAGTIAESAAIEIEWVPTVWRCADCDAARETDDPATACGCGSVRRRFDGNDDLLLTSLDVEGEDEDSST